MDGLKSSELDISPEAVDREVRAIFTSFAKQFKDLPGNTAEEKAHSYVAGYIEQYRAGHRAADG